MIRVLHIANNAAYENNPITEAFREQGYYVIEVDFIKCLFQKKMSNRHLVNYILEVAQNMRPNFIFMQIQHAGVINYEDAYYLNQIAPLISYSGDVRNNTDFHELMCRAGALTIVNNDEDIEKLRFLGFNADYLQVSFHQGIHNPNNRSKVKKGKIAFLGNNYGENTYPLSKERQDICLMLKREFKDGFTIFGNGWQDVGIHAAYIDPKQSSYIYSQHEIAINHSNYQRSRYTSDRLFYILASGTFCLTHWYPKIEEEFTDGKHLVVYKNADDLLEKCHYWLSHENENRRNDIAMAGCDYVHTSCTWQHRIKDLNNILNKYYPTAMTKNDNWIEALSRMAPEKHYSQFGEESFIGHIFNSVGTKHKYFVDLGAGDGVNLSNTKFFKDSLNWNGLMVDADRRGNQEVYESFITDDNIIDILEKHNVPEDFDFLSIDLDGNDYYVLDSILTDYQPRLVLAEFNGTIPVGVCKVMEYNANHTWGNDDYYGASFEAFKRLGNAHGYATIFSYASTNIYLLRKDLLCEPEKDWGVTYQPMQYHAHNPNGRWIIYQ